MFFYDSFGTIQNLIHKTWQTNFGDIQWNWYSVEHAKENYLQLRLTQNVD